VVLVEDRGRPVLSLAYGMADPEKGMKNRLETPFNIASVGKIFTATAIGQLMDAGKVRLDDRVSTYLPELPEHLGRITVRQLLNHSSGVGEIMPPKDPEKFKAARSARELLGLIEAEQPRFEPGTKRFYSNSGPVLAAAIIEKITGERFADYLEDRVFKPTRMMQTSVKGPPSGAARMLTYSEDLTGPMVLSGPPSGPRNVVPLTGEWGSGYGNGYSSALDLSKFAEALRTNRLLSSQTRAALWAGPKPVIAGPGLFAQGFQIFAEGKDRVVGHSAFRGGANAEFHFAPEGSWTLVVLSNYDPMGATIIANAAKLSLTGLEPPSNACAAARAGRGMPAPQRVP
jgi:CubicO group peptidase (beta-lactamase class C family)